jgi:hypothetical protein
LNNLHDKLLADRLLLSEPKRDFFHDQTKNLKASKKQKSKQKSKNLQVLVVVLAQVLEAW